MTKKLTLLLLAVCLMLSACGSNNAKEKYDSLKEKYEDLQDEHEDLQEEYEELLEEYEDLIEEYEEYAYYEDSPEVSEPEQEENDVAAGETNTPPVEEVPAAPAAPANLQTYSYVTAMNEYPGEGNLDFTITYDNDILTVGAEIDCVAVYLWKDGGRDWENPHAYMNVRSGSWEEHYANPYSKWDFGRFEKTDVYESYPLSINGYDGYGWAIYIEETYLDWCNDVYIYTVQLDPEHYLYIESSRLSLQGDCSFEELLTALLHDVTIP